MNQTIPGISKPYRELEQPWRIGVVFEGNNPRMLGEPWLRFEFVNSSDASDTGYEVVGLEEAEQLEEQQARQRLEKFAGQSLSNAFILIPPEDIELEEVYKGPAEILQGEVRYEQ